MGRLAIVLAHAGGKEVLQDSPTAPLLFGAVICETAVLHLVGSPGRSPVGKDFVPLAWSCPGIVLTVAVAIPRRDDFAGGVPENQQN